MLKPIVIGASILMVVVLQLLILLFSVISMVLRLKAETHFGPNFPVSTYWIALQLANCAHQFRPSFGIGARLAQANNDRLYSSDWYVWPILSHFNFIIWPQLFLSIDCHLFYSHRAYRRCRSCFQEPSGCHLIDNYWPPCPSGVPYLLTWCKWCTISAVFGAEFSRSNYCLLSPCGTLNLNFSHPHKGAVLQSIFQ